MSETIRTAEVIAHIYPLVLVDYGSREFVQYLIPVYGNDCYEGAPMAYFQPKGEFDTDARRLTLRVKYRGDYPFEILSVEPTVSGRLLMEKEDPDQLYDYIIDDLPWNHEEEEGEE